MKKLLKPAALLTILALGAARVLAHGDGAPQPVDTTGLKPLGEDWLAENPYRGDAKAIEIGARG
jgi:hypothetical protein